MFFYRKCIKNKYIVVVKVQTSFDCYKTCTNTQKVLHLDKIICQLPMKMNALKSIQNGLLTYSFSTFLLHLRTLESPRLNVNLIPRLLAQFRKRKGKVNFSQMKQCISFWVGKWSLLKNIILCNIYVTLHGTTTNFSFVKTSYVLCKILSFGFLFEVP